MISVAQILVVEDETIVALDLVGCLTTLGYVACASVPTGEQALEFINHTRLDLVLMDIHLPGALDGVATAQQVRQRFDIPVVFLTAYSDPATLERARQAEPYGYILKPFTERELGSNIEMALYKHRAEVARRAYGEQLAALNEMGRAVTVLRDFPHVLEVIYQQIQLVLPLDMFFVCLYDQATTEVTYALVYDEGQRYTDFPSPLAVHTNTRRVIESAQPFLINRTAEEIRTHGLSPYVVGNKTRVSASLLFAPLLVGERVIGAISAQSYTAEVYSENHLAFLSGVANFAAIAIENARLFAAAQHALMERQRAEASLSRQNRYWEVLHHITLELLYNRNMDDLLQIIVRRAAEILDAPNCKLMLITGAELVVRAVVPDVAFLRGYRLGRDQAALTWRAYDTHQPIVENNRAVIQPSKNPDLPQLQAVAELPIVVGADCLGVLALGRTVRGYIFTAQEIQIGQMLCRLVALALVNANLYEAAMHEITERKQAEEEIRFAKQTLETTNQQLQAMYTRERVLARTDGLTGVNNRRYFYDLAAHEFSSAMRYHHPLTTIMFDIDHFKHFNDTYGHQAGDEILKHVAQAASAQLREADILARYGGEEFIVLLPNTDAAQAIIVAERMREAVMLVSITVEVQRVSVTISLGVAEAQWHNDSLDWLTQRADEALYAAKGAGRNCTVSYTQIDSGPGAPLTG